MFNLNKTANISHVTEDMKVSCLLNILTLLSVSQILKIEGNPTNVDLITYIFISIQKCINVSILLFLIKGQFKSA